MLGRVVKALPRRYSTTHHETFPPEERDDRLIHSKFLSFLRQRAVDLIRVSQVRQRLPQPAHVSKMMQS